MYMLTGRSCRLRTPSEKEYSFTMSGDYGKIWVQMQLYFGVGSSKRLRKVTPEDLCFFSEVERKVVEIQDSI